MVKKSGDLPRGIDKRTSKNRAGKTVTMYRARVSFEGQQYSIGNFFTLGDAKAALAIARSEIALRTFVPPSERRRLRQSESALSARDALTVREWADKWLEALVGDGRSPGTITSYRSTLRVHILGPLGELRLVDVEPDDIDDLLAKVRATKGPWANVARTLRAMFRAAAEDRAVSLKVSPVLVSIPKGSPADDTLDRSAIASPEEVRRMAEAMPEELRIAVHLAAWCALRLGEVLGLQRHDLEHLDDPKRATLHVRRQWLTKLSPPGYGPPKRGSARPLAIPAHLLPALRDHLKDFTPDDPEAPLLPSSKNPARPIGQTAFDRAWRAAREAVRPGFTFHNLRHTGLTIYAQQGATLTELKKRGGHRNTEAAMKYQHSSIERDRALTERLSATVGEEPS